MNRMLMAGAAAAVMVAGSAWGAETLVNTPGPIWTVYGTLAQSSNIRDKDAKGGHAVQISVSGKGANPYDAGAQTPITKAVHKGDHLWFVFYARSPTATADHPIHLPVAVQLAQAPYTVDFQGTVDVGPDWGEAKHIDGVVQADHPAGSILGAIQLAGDKQVIVLGPAVMTDTGPDS